MTGAETERGELARRYGQMAVDSSLEALEIAERALITASEEERGLWTFRVEIAKNIARGLGVPAKMVEQVKRRATSP